MPENREYIKNADEFGSVSISEDVVTTIATIAADEVKNLTLNPAGGRKPLRVQIKGDTVVLDAYVKAAYGTKIPAAAAELQKVIEQALESMAGLNVDAVNIHVNGLEFAEEKAE